MTEELKEVIEACEKINEELNEQIGEEVVAPLSIEIEPLSYCRCKWIKWLGITIWCSEDEDREWIEETEPGKPTSIPAHYEPIEPYIRRKINELISSLNKIKL